MKSAVSRCTVTHARHKPATHAFSYPFYTYALNLDELEELDSRLPLFGYNRFAPSSIHDRDYLDRGAGTIKEKLLNRLQSEGITGIKEAYLVTQLKFFGYVFNPVSFYYCYQSKAQNAVPACIICEVNNTFNERHLYILKNDPQKKSFPLQYTAQKKFHVSPFNNRKGTYHFTFGNIRKELNVSIALDRDGGKMFYANIKGTLDRLSPSSHVKTIMRLPLIPFQTIPRIFYQALKLFFLKKLQYYPKPVPESVMTIRKNKPTALERFCYNQIHELLKKIEHGHLTLVQPEGEVLEFGNKRTGKTAKMIVNEWAFYKRLVLDGDIGFGEGFVDRQLDSPDIAVLCMLFLDNSEIFKGGNFATTAASRLLGYISYIRHHNSMTGSKKNISMHYDLSNEFFATFLDQTMLYSAAVFKSSSDSLKKAQLNKVHNIIDKLQISKNDHVLEIGCGWGGFAIEAVKKTGCRVTGVTISKQQYDYAVRKIEQLGLQKQITIELKDYRLLEGTYDKIVSIEMAEAVGEKYLGNYVNKIDSLMKKESLALLQIITMPDNKHDQYKRQSDWIKKHIFNGGHLPSLTEMSVHLKKNTQLFIHNLENIGTHYAKTLMLWRVNFDKNIPKIKKLGFDDEFIRKWRYYLASCEAAFETRMINDIQILLTRENNYLL